MPAYLTHLDGLRFLACLWIVTSHFANPRIHSKLQGLLERGFVAVDFFIVLSGFTTHYASAGKPLDSGSAIARFHLQRIGRILPLHWLCVILQMFTQSSWTFFSPLNIIGSFLLTTAWNCYKPYPDARDEFLFEDQCEFWPFNPLHWTLSTMLFSWLLYPLTRRLVLSCSCNQATRLLLALTILAISQLPAQVAAYYVPGIRNGVFNFLYQFPPWRVPDFLFGMACAQIALDDGSRLLASRVWPYLVDLAAVSLTILLLVTKPSRSGFDAYLLSGLNPFFAIILLGGCQPSSSSSSTQPNGSPAGKAATSSTQTSLLLRFASSSPLSTAGKYSFHMYLLQELLAKLIMGLQFYTDRECDDMKECVSLVGSKIFKQGGEIRSHFWLLYCFVLLGTAMMWCYYVEEPWVGWLKGRLESWEARGGAAAASTVSQQPPEEVQSPSGRIQVTPLSKREPSPNKPLSQVLGDARLERWEAAERAAHETLDARKPGPLALV